MRRIMVLPASSFVDVDGVGFNVTMPADADPTHPLKAIHWDGLTGQIERRSEVPGRSDVQHIMKEDHLAPYIAAWQVEKDKSDAARRAEADALAELETKRVEQEAASAAAPAAEPEKAG